MRVQDRVDTFMDRQVNAVQPQGTAGRVALVPLAVEARLANLDRNPMHRNAIRLLGRGDFVGEGGGHGVAFSCLPRAERAMAFTSRPDLLNVFESMAASIF